MPYHEVCNEFLSAFTHDGYLRKSDIRSSENSNVKVEVKAYQSRSSIPLRFLGLVFHESHKTTAWEANQLPGLEKSTAWVRGLYIESDQWNDLAKDLKDLRIVSHE